MGKTPKAPPPPDMSGIARAMQMQADQAFQMQTQQMALAKEQFAKTQETTDKVVADALARQDKLDAIGAEDRARYQAVFQPLEDKLASEAQDYATPARLEFEAGKATAAVSRQFENARTAAQDRLESFGIDPSQVRAGALDVGTRVAEAAARAGAGTQARERAETLGRGLRSEAINVGRGYPGQALGAYGAATGTGQGAGQTAFGTAQSMSQTMGTPMQWGAMGMQGLGGSADVQNAQYKNVLDRFKANQAAPSGWGTALGLAGGLGMSLLKPRVPGYAEGGPVPDEMSPSRGVAIDDVPATGPTGEIKLNGGEFVVPDDVTAWKGEEFFQKLITSSRENKSKAPAQPEMRQALALSAHPAVRAAVGAPPMTYPGGNAPPGYAEGGVVYDAPLEPTPAPELPPGLLDRITAMVRGGPSPMEPQLADVQRGAPVTGPGMTRRPNVLPVTRDAETGELQFALPRALDIRSYSLPSASAGTLVRANAMGSLAQKADEVVTAVDKSDAERLLPNRTKQYLPPPGARVRRPALML